MTDKHISNLELNKVLQRLSLLTNCPDAAEAAMNIFPSGELYEVKRRLDETAAAHALMARYGAPSFGGISNVNNALTRSNAGGALSVTELLHIGENLRIIRSLSEWSKNIDAEKDPIFDAIMPLFEALEPNKYLEQKIFSVIMEDGSISDNASSELANIRRKIRSAGNRVREQLEKMIRSASTSKYLQELIVTQRGGRFVVPVKAEYRGNVAGLVHDTSSSGATVFIEPMSVVETNNDIKLLETQEQLEIDRILWELSVETGGFAGGIINSYETAVLLNICFAKARLGFDMRAGVPLLNDSGRVLLKNARHPLLDPKTAVPINISLGINYDTLIITGPNTGGKTVSLKTLGLLTLMVMCGLMIPVSDGSEAAVFANVLSDIGDEQSIEQSLSTFSSHMVNIISMLDSADDNSLVLLDELCSGTDPVEGAALAMSIIDNLRASGSKITATTHYPELKAFALETAGVENGCCEFDVETLRPTYKLIIGQPGRSNAFAISRRLGLQENIVDQAAARLSDTDVSFDRVVEALENSRLQFDEERERLETERETLKASLTTAKTEQEKFNEISKKAMEKVHAETRDIIEKMERKSADLLFELNDIKKNIDKDNASELVAKARQMAKSGVSSLEKMNISGFTETSAEKYVPPRPFAAGDDVTISDINKPAVILTLSSDGKSATVQAGIIKTVVPLENLRLIVAQKQQPLQPMIKASYSKGKKMTGDNKQGGARILGPELDIRGTAADEGIMLLDRFIDEAVLTGEPQVVIIHGRGTGVLRAAVHAHLKKHPSVSSYRLGVYGEGEDGVTVVQLK